MMRLNAIEQECQDVLIVVSDMLSPGRRMSNMTHTQICGLVRNALIKLQNKEFGCISGKHSGVCQCKE